VTHLKTNGDTTLKGEDWWKAEIDFLKRLSKNKNHETALLGARLLNMVYAHFIESSPQYIERKDYEMAITLAKLWNYAQPESVWARWTLARNYALNGNKEKALKTLGKAYDLGMSRVESLTGNPAFDILKGDPRYTALIEKLQQKKIEG